MVGTRRNSPPPGVPTLDEMTAMVGHQLGKLRSGTAAGLDGLPAEFLKYATVRQVDERGKPYQENVLAPILSNFFHTIVSRKKVPSSWKEARLSPLYKKGPVAEPNSYRMLAVSSAIYRLFANVVRDWATEWAMSAGRVPEAQFGFIPGRSTMQPMFILRHLIKHVKHTRPGNSPRLYTAFMDFTQAYDHVDRGSLWQHLSRIGMPDAMRGTIEAMYCMDRYKLVDGLKATNPLHPLKGVKQGCPLSPLLFALYINDFRCEESQGVPLQRVDRCVNHMFYADDLVLMSTTAKGLQEMLAGLESYSRAKGLTVNASKSKVVVFNSKRVREEFRYGDAFLEVVDEFTYLGVRFHKDGSMRHADSQWAGTMVGAIQQIVRVASEHGVTKRIDLMLDLFQSYVIPSGLYAAHIWGTSLLSLDKAFKSKVQTQHSCFLRHLVRARRGTSSWCLLHEMGQKPFHYYWWRAVLTFWNVIQESNSALLRDVVKSDIGLATEGCTGCWVSEVRTALLELPAHRNITRQAADLLMAGHKLDNTDVLSMVEEQYRRYWHTFEQVQDYRRDEVQSRKMVTYAQCFKLPEVFPKAPIRQYARMPHSLTVKVARFRLGSHHLEVERGRWSGVTWDQRKCNRCSTEYLQRLPFQVDDEHHMIFDCESFQTLRTGRVLEILESSNGFSTDLWNHQEMHRFIAEAMLRVDEGVVEEPPAQQPRQADG